MASLRKKYQEQVEVGPTRDEPPVSTPPQVTAAELPEQSADAGKPPPEIESEGPGERAAKDAIQLRLRLQEMEHADQMQRQAAQQQQVIGPH
jgi:hypothetical protein